MSRWRLSIRLCSNAPNGKRDAVAFAYQLEDLREVPDLIDLAARSGQIVYVMLAPMPGLLEQFCTEHQGRHGKRRPAAIVR